MILVLLYRFSESLDSIIGYNFCKFLVQKGYDLLVTSTATGTDLENEKKVAKRLSEMVQNCRDPWA